MKINFDYNQPGSTWVIDGIVHHNRGDKVVTYDNETDYITHRYTNNWKIKLKYWWKHRGK